MTDVILALEGIVLLVATPWAIWSAIQLVRIHRRTTPPRVPLFTALVASDRNIAIVLVYFAYAIIASIFRNLGLVLLPTLPTPWGTIAFGLGLIVLCVPPIQHWQAAKQMRRQRLLR